ncbi:hypothetical protein [Malaciobacter marinus]|uniref:hypothetical protein n=1 Tax=Malaciobacter marinus TaxID=505249 RepID=UPI003B007B20
MILNPYSRAIIFDDEEDKIKPILDLFKKHLVPQLFVDFSTSPEDIEDEKKLKNIRLVFSDFIKGEISGSNPGQLTNIINAITSTISKENGPFIIVTWSAHTMQFLGPFRKELKSAGYIFEDIVLEKEKYLRNPNLDEMLKDINEKLKTKENFLNFLNWENKVKISASNIIGPFMNLKESKRKETIKNLSKASLGSSFDSSHDNLLKGFYNTMTNLLYDEIEKNISLNKSETIVVEDENDIANDTAFINTKLMIDKNIKTNDNNYPGNVYAYNDFLQSCDKTNSSLHEICGFEIDDLKESIFDRKELENINNSKLDMICIEISPYCDHAQKNMKKAKLITGFILEEEIEDKAKSKADFIYKSNKFFLKRNNSKQVIHLSFRHIFRVNPTFVNSLKPRFRIRKEMVNEIQHQTAYYLSRPGLTTLYEN